MSFRGAINTHKKNQHLIVQLDIAIYMTIRRETEKMLLEYTYILQFSPFHEIN